MANIKSVAKSINKAWGENVLASGNFTKELRCVDVGDLGVTYPLSGGIPYGQIVSVSGVEHSGKTLFCAAVIAAYQRENPDKVCVYFDAENTLTTMGSFLQKMTGIDFSEDHFLRYDCTGKSAEEIFTDAIKLQESEDAGIFCIDSCPALVPQIDLENDLTKDLGQRGNISKVLGRFLRQMMMYLPKRNNILLLINQVRIEQGFGGSLIYKEPCGYSIPYYSSLRLRFGTRTFTLGDKTDISPTKGEGADGFRLKFMPVKSRLGALNKGGGFLTFRYDTGLDATHDMLEIAMKFGYIQRPNNMTYILANLETGEVYRDTETGEDLKFIGKQKLLDYLHSHKAFLKEYSTMLTKHISASTSSVDLLDDNDRAEILEQEKALNAQMQKEAEFDSKESKDTPEDA